MKVNVYNYDTGAMIYSLTVKDSEMKDLFALSRLLNMKQMSEDVLGIGYSCSIIDLGINWYTTKHGVMSNAPDAMANSDSRYGVRQAILGASNCSAEEAKKYEPDFVRIRKDNGDTEETKLRIMAVAYKEGYVLNVNKKGYNLFGVGHDMYFKSIGKSKIHFEPIERCRVFPTTKAMLKYLQDNISMFVYIVKSGYYLSLEPVNSYFTADLNSIPGKDQKYLDELNQIIEMINKEGLASDTSNASETVEEGIATEDEMRSEAVKRMKSLNILSTAIRQFESNNEIYMSEAGGILLDLNADAKAAVSEVNANGAIPYAVVHNHTSLGEMYTVLFVDKHKEDWNYQRPDRDNIFSAYVYNATEPMFSEYGDVGIRGANGGLVRFA